MGIYIITIILRDATRRAYVHDDGGPVVATLLDLHYGRRLGHHHCALDAQQLRMIAEALRMVAQRRGNDAAFALLVVQHQQCVSGAALFETIWA